MSNKKISACIFPDTMPVDDVMFPLVHIFSQLVYSRPVEVDGEDIEPDDFVRMHVPAPLGGERDRFLSLLSEMHSRSDDYATQLKNLVFFKSGAGKSETKSSIISNLRNSMGADDRKAEELELLLWQARLVLSLGEFFDQDQQDLSRELAMINEREKGLLAELRRENNHPFDLTRTISETFGQTDGLQRLRLKAWSRLFCLGHESLNSVSCFVTTDRDVVDMMAEVYEKLRGNNVESLITLSLPSLTPAASMQSDKIKQLQQADLPVILSRIFSGSGEQGRGIDYDNEILQSEWEKLLENLYPVADTGRLKLHVYKFSDIQPCSLFLESFARKGGQGHIEKENQGVGGSTIICWLESDTHPSLKT